MLLNACMSDTPGARLSLPVLEWPMAVLKLGVSLRDLLITLGLHSNATSEDHLPFTPRVAPGAPPCSAPHESASARVSY